MSRLDKLARRVVAAVVLAFIVANGLAYVQSRALTRYVEGGDLGPERSSFLQKVGWLLGGVPLPRPRNHRQPSSPFEIHAFPGTRGLRLEAWYIPRHDARAVVVLFHGYAGAKAGALREARIFRELGYAPFLVDFHGSGGSEGRDTTVGFDEAEDVESAVLYAAALPGRLPVVVYGESMGAAAVLKALSDRRLPVRAAVLEAPFDRLLTTVRHRFESFSLPSFPAAELLVFWGGVHGGFDAFRHDPVEYACRVDCPVLLFSGAEDPWVRPEESKSIAAALRGPAEQILCEGVGHEPCSYRRPAVWREAVGGFLERWLAASAADRRLATRD